MDKYLIKMFPEDKGVILPEIQVIWLIGSLTWENRILPQLADGKEHRAGNYLISRYNGEEAQVE